MLEPVFKTNKTERIEAWQKCIISFANRLKDYQPKMIIILMKSIAKEVKEAVKLSGVNSITMIHTTSFPSMSERNRLECVHGVQNSSTGSFKVGYTLA